MKVLPGEDPLDAAGILAQVEWRCDNCNRTVEEVEVDPHGTSGMCLECDDDGDEGFALPEREMVVTWSIGLDAVDSLDAARQALGILQDPHTTATVFIVGDGAMEYRVDLSDNSVVPHTEEVE